MASSSARPLQPRHIDAGAAIVGDEDETFEERQQRHGAARILESNQLLMWLAMSRNESLPQTRRHYERVLFGFESDSEEPEWEDVFEPSESDEERLRPTRGGSGSGGGSSKRSSLHISKSGPSGSPGSSRSGGSGGGRERAKKRKSAGLPMRAAQDEGGGQRGGTPGLE